MSAVTRTYEGEDLVIPRQVLEELGVRPGEQVVIQPKLNLEPRQFGPGERERLEQLLTELAGSWTEEQEAEYRRNKELWSAWQPRDLS